MIRLPPAPAGAEPGSHWKKEALQGLQRVLVGAALLGCALAAAAQDLPAAQTAGEVRFVTGGVGEGEAAAFRREQARYPLTVEVYVHEGGRDQFTADAQVTLRNARRENVLQERTEGPFLLADVPPGRYDVQVDWMGQTQRRSVEVREKRPARAVFVFRAS